jgi:hypothetical protein
MEPSRVERGWTSVIAGSTALSCGIVTIALGIILHRLSGLHSLLKTGKGLTLLPRELAKVGSPYRFDDEGHYAFLPIRDDGLHLRNIGCLFRHGVRRFLF